MSRLTVINDHIKTTHSVSETVKTLQEVSVIRMQSVRDSVLETRGYLDGLLDIYVSVRNLHQREIEQILNNKKWWSWRSLTKQTVAKGNGKTLLILISPSQRLSGELIHRVFSEFADAAAKAPGNVELAVVGAVGRDLFSQRFGVKKSYVYFDWREDRPDYEALTVFLSQLSGYEFVKVFTAEFHSLVQQTPRQLQLSGNQELSQTPVKVGAPVANTQFLCEPSLDEIVKFFEHQVVASLFKQALAEAKLAHLGSRITALELATQTIMLETKKLERQARHLQRQKQQSKQLQRLSGMSVWYAG